MTREIIAFFASSFLCVAATIPVHAEEKTGIVAEVDPERATITFEDGSRYAVPRGFDYAAVTPGTQAHVILN